MIAGKIEYLEEGLAQYEQAHRCVQVFCDQLADNHLRGRPRYHASRVVHLGCASRACTSFDP